MFEKIHNWLHRHECFVIADATDNSITFSKQLVKQLRLDELEQAKVFVFEIKKESGPKTYGFMLNPSIGQETQLADIMYNSKHKCVGFECLVPTVNRIFYDYGLPPHIKCRLSVRERQLTVHAPGRKHGSDGRQVYYEICRTT